MIGYITNGYKLWNPEEKQVYYERDVKFDESKFKIPIMDTEFWLPSEETREEEIIKTEDQATINDACKDSSEDKYYNAEKENAESSAQNSEENLEKGPRRSSRVRSRPKYLDDYTVMAYNAENYLADVPENFDEIDSREDKEEWMQAVNEEISALNTNNTWTLCSLSKDKRAISSR